ncbi:MerR family DNA-binding transcriptional regulator [Candidatus Daviesbacteria bacterium]|nr:MerR family DNA-binding transcriptional regulator [Candidatus Daviesbacteria bacterium]
MQKPSDFVKIGQASKILKVSIDTLRRWERAGKITAIRTPGGTRLYSLDSLSAINPKSVADHQARVQTTEELLKKTEEQPIDGRKWNIEVEDLSTINPLPSIVKKTFLTNFLITGGVFSSLVLITVAGIVASYLTSPDTTKQFMKGNIASALLAPLDKLAQDSIGIISPKKAEELGFIPLDLKPDPPPPLPINDKQLTINDSDVLAETASSQFLEVNTDTQINSSLFVTGLINNLKLEATPSSSNIIATSGDTTLTVTNNATLDQNVSTTSSPTFSSLTLSASNAQITSGGFQFTLPGATTTLVGTDTTQTLTNKSLSGSANTFTNIPNSALSNSAVTVTAGTNLTGGGTVSLGGSITLSAKSSPSFSGVVLISDGTASAPGLAFTDDTDSGLYRIGANNIALITGGTAGQGITIDASGNVGLGTISPSTKLHVVGTGNITSNATIGGTLGITGATTLSSTLTVSGDTTIDTNTLFVDSSNNRVGIGTTSPDTQLQINSGANGLFVTSAGNLGLGATTSSNKLDVWGNTRITGTLTVDGSTTSTSSLLLPDGSASSPALAFINDTDTGIYRPGDNLLSFATGGADRLRIDSNGNVGIGTTLPDYNLRVNGTGYFSDFVGIGSSLNVSGNVGIGQSLTVTSAAALSTLNVSGISNLAGNTGIGASLNVSGLSFAQGGLRVNGFSDLTGNVGIGSSLNVSSASILDSLSVTKSISTATLGTLTVSSGGVFNSSLAVSGHSSLSTLSTSGASTFNGGLTFAGVPLDITTGLNESLTIIPNGTGNVGIGYSSPYAKLFVLGAGTGTGINFQTVSSTQVQGLTVLDNGNVGIGTTNPNYQLQITGTGNFGNIGVGGSLVVSGNVGVGQET